MAGQGGERTVKIEVIIIGVVDVEAALNGQQVAKARDSLEEGVSGDYDVAPDRHQVVKARDVRDTGVALDDEAARDAGNAVAVDLVEGSHICMDYQVVIVDDGDYRE